MAPKPFEKAISEIAYVVSNVPGIKQAPAQPSETQNEYPFAAIYLATGTLGLGPTGTHKSLYNIAIDVLTNRMDLPNDLSILHPFIDLITSALDAEVSNSEDGLPGGCFNGTISTFESVSISFLPKVDYAGVQMIGYRFLMNNVKILSNA
jgi:hypothetical protein